MNKVLVVEDSQVFAKILKRSIETDTPYKTVIANSMKEAEEKLQDHAKEIFASVLDLNLPDAPTGAIVDLVLSNKIPVVVFSADMGEEIRSFIWSKDIAEYVLKRDPQCLNHVGMILKRIEKNKDVGVLIVDDSRAFRKMLKKRLEAQRFKVFQAADGNEALYVLEKESNISLVITDLDMPGMDGFDLTRKIREKYSRHDVSIIVLSASNESSIISRLLKTGANDYIVKTNFFPEEFYCRVNQCVEYIEHVHVIREAGLRDALTGLHNRRYFMETGLSLYREVAKKNGNIICAMLDIDFFKKVNDTYGHDAGDAVLISVSSIIGKEFKDASVLARVGGEEYCIICVDWTRGKAIETFENLRTSVEKSSVTMDNGEVIKVTISIGVVEGLFDGFEKIISEADTLLYSAKEGGRNRVINNFST